MPPVAAAVCRRALRLATRRGSLSLLALLLLGCLLAVLLAMLPVFLLTRQADADAERAAFFPPSATSLPQLQQADQLIMKIALLRLLPAERSATFLFDFIPGGSLAAAIRYGVIVLPDLSELQKRLGGDNQTVMPANLSTFTKPALSLSYGPKVSSSSCHPTVHSLLLPLPSAPARGRCLCRCSPLPTLAT